MLLFVYKILQCTWGIIQTLLGFIIFLLHCKNKHFCYHGAIVTQWQSKSSMSLGLFVFVTSEPFFTKKTTLDFLNLMYLSTSDKKTASEIGGLIF